MAVNLQSDFFLNTVGGGRIFAVQGCAKLQCGADRFVQGADMVQGDAIISSAWLVHRVTLVVEWASWTFVGWWQGAPFRLSTRDNL